MPGLIVTMGRAVAAGALAGAMAGCVAGHPRIAHTSGPVAAVQGRTPGAAAHASGLPGLYLGSMAGPWYDGPRVRPAALLLGADWTISELRWTDWSRLRADGRGYEVGCQGARGPCHRFWAVVAAAHVRVHAGSRHFAVMKVTGRRQRVMWLVMNTKLGWWQQSDRP